MPSVFLKSTNVFFILICLTPFIKYVCALFKGPFTHTVFRPPKDERRKNRAEKRAETKKSFGFPKLKLSKLFGAEKIWKPKLESRKTQQPMKSIHLITWWCANHYLFWSSITNAKLFFFCQTKRFFISILDWFLQLPYLFLNAEKENSDQWWDCSLIREDTYKICCERWRECC